MLVLTHGKRNIKWLFNLLTVFVLFSADKMPKKMKVLKIDPDLIQKASIPLI